MSSCCSWNTKVICGIHNHGLDEDIDGHCILFRLKPKERLFENDMIKYNVAPRCIISALKNRNTYQFTIKAHS